MLGAWPILHATESLLAARFVSSLANTLAANGKRVLLFDLSPECPALDILLGVDGRVVYTLCDVGRVPPCDVLLSPCKNLFFVPLGVGEQVEASKITAVTEAVTPDAVLFVTTRSTFTVVRSLSDGALLLTDASPVALRAASALTSAHRFDGFVLTDFHPVREAVEGMPALTEMADLLEIPLFGILPQTDLYNTHTVREKNFLTAIENMTGRLMGEAVPLLRGISIEGMRRKRFFTRISE